MAFFMPLCPENAFPVKWHTICLFGYDKIHFPGRGLLEAVGESVPFKDDDILSLSHLAGGEFDNGIPILIRGRDETTGSKEALGELFKEISEYESQGIFFRLVQTRRNDAILIMSGKVSSYVL